MMKKVAFAGLLAAAAVLGNVGSTSLAANSSTGVNLIQGCNTSVVLSGVNVGANGQGSSQGDCGGDAANSSTGLNLIQLCNTSVVGSIVNIGLNEQESDQDDCGGDAVNSSTGLNLIQACNTSLVASVLSIGDNGQGSVQGDCGSDGDEGSGDHPSSADNVNESTGLNLVQLANTNIVAGVVNIGESLMGANTP